MSLLRHVYDSHSTGEASWVHRLHRAYIGSRAAARWHLGLRTRPHAGWTCYFDLTTILLRRTLKRKIRRSPDIQILEMGAGSWAALCGCLSRHANRTIDSAELEAAKVESARSTAELNRFNVNVFQSDLFQHVPDKKYELIFWNLPYYFDPNDYLRRFFQQAPDYMTPAGELVIGYNTKPLPRATVLRLLEEQPKLKLTETLTWWWNLHDLLVIKLK